MKKASGHMVTYESPIDGKIHFEFFTKKEDAESWCKSMNDSGFTAAVSDLFTFKTNLK